jgi:hypothetical protein
VVIFACLLIGLACREPNPDARIMPTAPDGRPPTTISRPPGLGADAVYLGQPACALGVEGRPTQGATPASAARGMKMALEGCCSGSGR